MHAERDHLVRMVFPELKARCRTKRVHLIDVDLRWGVTEADAEGGKALDICLDEIDTCRPYFLGILGRRYGYIPDGHEPMPWFVVVNDKPGPEFDFHPSSTYRSDYQPVCSCDGNKVAYAAGQSGKEFIVVNDNRGPQFDDVRFPEFSPDGSKVKYYPREIGKIWRKGIAVEWFLSCRSGPHGFAMIRGRDSSSLR